MIVYPVTVWAKKHQGDASEGAKTSAAVGRDVKVWHFFLCILKKLLPCCQEKNSETCCVLQKVKE